MAKNERRKKTPLDQQWTAVPAKRSRIQDADFRAKLVLGTLTFCALLGILSTLAWISSGSQETVTPYRPPVGGGVAEAAAHLYLSGGKPATPAVLADRDAYTSPSKKVWSQDVLWPEMVTTARYPVTAESSILVERHTFLFVEDGQLRRITVPVSIQEGGVATVAGTPAVMPYEIGLESGASLELRLVDGSAPQAVVDKLQRWAQAYMADRRGELADIAGNVSGTYSGLGGWTVQETALLGYGFGAEPGLFVARLRVTAVKEADPELKMVQIYDLVVDQRGDVPYIVRWGPIGTR